MMYISYFSEKGMIVAPVKKMEAVREIHPKYKTETEKWTIAVQLEMGGMPRHFPIEHLSMDQAEEILTGYANAIECGERIYDIPRIEDL